MLRIFRGIKNRLFKIFRIFIISQKSKSFTKYLLQTSDTKRIYIFFVPEWGNLGDHAIVLAENEFFKKYFPEYQIVEVTQEFDGPVAKCLSTDGGNCNNAIITVPGGGFLGNLWIRPSYFTKNILNRFPNNKVVFFPNTIFFEKNRTYKKEILETQKSFLAHKNCHIFIRDKSFEYFKNKIVGNDFKTSYNIPDIVLFINRSDLNLNRDGVLCCFRNDKEKVQNSAQIEEFKNLLQQKNLKVQTTDTVQPYNIVSSCRNFEVEQKFKQFASSRLVITDRLHGMIFAAITGTPCIALNNSSGKVEGVYSLWLKNLSYIKYVENIEDAKNLVDKMIVLGGQKYNPSMFEKYWKLLAAVIENREVQNV